MVTIVSMDDDANNKGGGLLVMMTDVDNDMVKVDFSGQRNDWWTHFLGSQFTIPIFLCLCSRDFFNADVHSSRSVWSALQRSLFTGQIWYKGSHKINCWTKLADTEEREWSLCDRADCFLMMATGLFHGCSDTNSIALTILNWGHSDFLHVCFSLGLITSSPIRLWSHWALFTSTNIVTANFFSSRPVMLKKPDSKLSAPHHHYCANHYHSPHSIHINHQNLSQTSTDHPSINWKDQHFFGPKIPPVSGLKHNPMKSQEFGLTNWLVYFIKLEEVKL